MAFGRIAIYVDTQHAGKKSPIEALRLIEFIIDSTLISDGYVEEAVGTEEHVATVVPHVAIVLIDEHKFCIRVRHRLTVRHREPAQPHPCAPISVRPIAPCRRENAIGRVLIPDVNVAAVGGAGLTPLGMKRETQ